MTKNIGILHQNFPYGGAETATIRLAEGLSQHGYTIYVFCTDYRKNLTNMSDNDYQVRVMPNPININSEENISYLSDKIKELSIACLCFSVNEFLPTLCRLKQTGETKLIYIQHGSPFWEKQFRLASRGTLGWKKIRIALIDRTKEKLFNYYTKRWQQQYTTIYDNCDFYVVLHSQYSHAIGRVIKKDEAKFIAISNMIKPVAFNAAKKKQILYCGRMSHIDKRVDRLINVWKSIQPLVPQWELVLVGDGEEYATLKEQVNKQHIQAVRFEGWQKDVNSYYREAAIICLTSTLESFGLCLTEGMSYGCVPIAFNCSAGVADIITGNGVLVSPFNQKEYAKRLLELIQNEELRNTLQKKSLESVRRFYPEEIIPQWIRLFEKASFS